MITVAELAAATNRRAVLALAEPKSSEFTIALKMENRARGWSTAGTVAWEPTKGGRL